MSVFEEGHGTPSAAPHSPWVERWAACIDKGARVLDFAGGAGRNLGPLLARTDRITVADRDAAALDAIAHPVERICADLESGPWPFGARSFDAVVCCNFLHRPRLDLLTALVAPGGVLLYETFALGNERHGGPSRPAFLLRPGELFEVAVRARLEVLAFEHGYVQSPRAAVVQRICAIRPPPGPQDRRRVG